jgi:hypothetical protein
MTSHERRQETTSPNKNLPDLPATIFLEKKMGKELGRGKVLQQEVLITPS